MAKRKSKVSSRGKRSKTSKLSRRNKRSRTSRVSRRGKRSKTSKLSRRNKRSRKNTRKGGDMAGGYLSETPASLYLGDPKYPCSHGAHEYPDFKPSDYGIERDFRMAMQCVKEWVIHAAMLKRCARKMDRARNPVSREGMDELDHYFQDKIKIWLSFKEHAKREFNKGGKFPIMHLHIPHILYSGTEDCIYGYGRLKKTENVIETTPFRIAWPFKHWGLGQAKFKRHNLLNPKGFLDDCIDSISYRKDQGLYDENIGGFKFRTAELEDIQQNWSDQEGFFDD